MTTRQKTILAALLGIAVLAGCKTDKDNELTAPAPVNEEELITDAYLRFHDNNGNTYQWHASAVGGLEQGGESGLQITADTLPANTLLQVEIILLNRSVTPVDTVSQEVLDEGEEHQFFFLSTNTNITISYADQDANGHPIGLHSTWQTGAPATGQVTVLLRHEPDKGAAGVSDGDITNAGGSNDLQVQFPAVAQ
jgi:hypothetical protein